MNWSCCGEERNHTCEKEFMAAVLPLLKHVRRRLSCCSAWEGAAARYLDSLKNFEKQGVPKGAGTDTREGFDLDRMRRLLGRLDDPHLRYPIVHVAGTKGKGSTATLISSILRAAGLSVGTYTSPHVSTIRERIVSGGKACAAISETAWEQLYQDSRASIHDVVVREAGAVTYFEVLTALAFAHFAREKVDIAVIEVGLGGARDATNVVPPCGVAASVIVSVGEEHLAALGGSLESIALAKAGIVKEGRPLILGRQPYDVAEKIICNVAASKQAKVIKSFGTDVRHTVLDLQFDHSTGAAFQTCDLAVDVPGDEGSQVFHAKALKLRLLGTHQLDNAATAVCTALSLRKQGWRIPDDCIQRGLESASMLGRFQILSPEEAAHLGCAPFIVILDGAHTRDSGAALAQSLQTLLPHHKLALVVAMAADKDHRGFASSFLLQGKRPQVVVTTQVLVAGSAERATPAHLLSQAWTAAAAADAGELGNVEDAPGPGASEEGQQLGLAVRSCSSFESALSEAGAYLKAHFGPEGGIVCVTGSLHAVGGALALLETRQKSQRWVAAEDGNGGGL